MLRVKFEFVIKFDTEGAILFQPSLVNVILQLRAEWFGVMCDIFAVRRKYDPCLCSVCP